MTEELTAEERAYWADHSDGEVSKLLRLYDAALARAEAAEKELAATDRLLTDQCSKKWGAESALAEATALLLRIKAWADSPLGEAKEPWVCLHNALDAHLPRTPAPAAKAERPNDGRSGRCGIRISGDHWCTLDHGHAGEHSVALTLCTEAERRVLEACAAFPTAALKHDAQINRNELSDLSLRWTEAELARRGQP